MNKQLHVTSIGTALDCLERYRRRYLVGDIIAPGIAAITGSSFHKATALDLTRKFRTGELASLEEVETTARDYVSGEFDRGAFMLLPEEQEQGVAWAKADSIDWAVRCAQVYHGDVAPGVVPAQVPETEFTLNMKNVGWQLLGKIDVIEKPNGRERILDSKTAGKRWSSTQADDSEQLTGYALQRKVATGMIPELAVDVVVKSETKKAGRRAFAERIVTSRTPERFEAFLRTFYVLVQTIEAGVFPPTGLGKWWCSPRWCGYFGTCPYVKGRKVVSLASAEVGNG